MSHAREAKIYSLYETIEGRGLVSKATACSLDAPLTIFDIKHVI